MDIRDVRAEAAEELQEALLYIAHYRFDEVADAYERASECFQACAICDLLATADREKFRVNLARSGQARRAYLRRAAESDRSDVHLALSRTDAFLDVLASGHVALAADITRRSASQWLDTREYEEDFLYFRFLHELVEASPTQDPTRFRALLVRWKAVDGGATPRFKACEAILERRHEGFDSALRARLGEHQASIDAKRPEIVESDFLFWPRSYVSIEGLALLRAAELAGIAAEAEYPMCPREARLPIHSPADVDFFEELDRAVGRRGA